MAAQGTGTLTLRNRWAYGCGGIAGGLYSNGVSYFLLVYYNQVIGLPAELAGLALSVALLFDAVSDPFVGFLSDNSRSRWGKRHPFMYASVVPLMVHFWLIWNPPETLETDFQIFLFLLAVTIGLRFSMTLFDVPHNALVPEITSDYHARTRIAGSKVSAGWISGQIMVIAMYVVWLVPTESMPYGILNQKGYQDAGLFSAIGIGLAVLISAIGLHHLIPKLKDSAHARSKSPAEFYRQFAAALKVPSLRAILMSSVAYAVAAGIGAALWTYLMSYYWELTNTQITLILVSNLIGALLASVTFKFRVTNSDKKRVAIELSLISVVIGALPYLLRYLGAFPANGSDVLIAILFVHGIAQVGLIVWTSSVLTSMTADVVEAGIVDHGYQNEGIITSVITFVLKAGTAGGLAVSGVLLASISFPQSAGVSNLTAEIVSDLGITYAVVTAVLYLVSVWFLTFYRIDRASQEGLVDAAAEAKATPSAE